MKQSPLIWILQKIRRRIPAVLLLTAAQMGNALLAVVFALGSRNVIDSAVSGNVALFRAACIRQALVIAALVTLIALSRHLRDRLGMDLERDWKRQLFRRLLRGDYSAVASYHSAELLNRLNNDVSRVNDGILTLVPGTASMAARLAGALAVLGVLDGRLTLLALALGAAVIGATALMRRRLKALNRQVSEHDGRVSALLQEGMEKLLMIQAMDVSAEMERRADGLMEDRYRVQRKRKNVSLVTNTGVAALSYGMAFLALLWCSWQLLQGRMTFGALTAVIQLVAQLQGPVFNLSGVMPQYAAMTAAAERLMELEAIPEEAPPMAAKPESVYAEMDALCAEGLRFSYDREQILDGADFSLPRGVFAVVTGPSGIGKSTILKLLLGIFRPEAGRLFLRCGANEIALDRSGRGLFAYVPQGNLLLSGTLRENLTIVRPDASEEEIRQAVHVSAMDEFLPQLPQGLDTVLGESGAGLSEGQAQRLAIARAVLGGAPILLLDECTSALDARTEQTVLERLKALPGRTCIAVTHRSAALALCDLRLEVSDGKIAVCNRE